MFTFCLLCMLLKKSRLYFSACSVVMPSKKNWPSFYFTPKMMVPPLVLANEEYVSQNEWGNPPFEDLNSTSPDSLSAVSRSSTGRMSLYSYIRFISNLIDFQRNECKITIFLLNLIAIHAQFLELIIHNTKLTISMPI